jgi:hypothetical protein
MKESWDRNNQAVVTMTVRAEKMVKRDLSD